MPERIDDGVVDEYSEPLPAEIRLRTLLFLVEKKLEQRRRLQLDVYAALTVLIAISLTLLSMSISALQYRRLLPGEAKDEAHSLLMAKGWGWTLALLLAPFVMSFLHYLWITFAQIYYRSLNVIDDLLLTSDFEEFRPVLHKELLDDDGSLLSQLRNLFTVDFGLTSTFFRVGGIACALLPVLAQAFVSIVATILLWRGNVGVAVGAGVFFALALTLALLKTWSLYRFVRRMK